MKIRKKTTEMAGSIRDKISKAEVSPEVVEFLELLAAIEQHAPEWHNAHRDLEDFSKAQTKT